MASRSHSHGQGSSHHQRVMEGPLSKWTNVMHGWQYRWFVLDQASGLLSYYTVSFPRPRPWGSRLRLHVFYRLTCLMNLASYRIKYKACSGAEEPLTLAWIARASSPQPEA